MPHFGADAHLLVMVEFPLDIGYLPTLLYFFVSLSYLYEKCQLNR
jgi:hypothetical protein